MRYENRYDSRIEKCQKSNISYHRVKEWCGHSNKSESRASKRHVRDGVLDRLRWGFRTQAVHRSPQLGVHWLNNMRVVRDFKGALLD